jgi:Holliday junction resolvase RusA-like endonuclease
MPDLDNIPKLFIDALSDDSVNNGKAILSNDNQISNMNLRKIDKC